MIGIVRNIGLFFRGLYTVGALVPKGTKDLDIILAAIRSKFDEADADVRTKIEELNSLARSTETDVLFATVGRALTSWSKMEEMLVIIAGHLLRSNPAKAGVLMYSILNPRPWFEALHDLFQMDEELITFIGRFDKISDRIGRLIDKRNRLAHHSVRMDSARIQPSKLDARTKSVKQQPLSIQEICDFTDAVLDITDDLHDLASKMEAALATSPETHRG